MKMVVSYLNFVFFVEVKAKSEYRILNFVFQFIKNTKWHFGYTDSPNLVSWLNEISQLQKYVYQLKESFKRHVVAMH